MARPGARHEISRLIASFRNLGEITKINTATGAVMWRFGGQRNTFTFPDAPATGFVGQHSARAYAPAPCF